MASNRSFRFGPVALTTTLTTEIFTPPVVAGGVGFEADISACYSVIRHIRILNKTASSATYSLYIAQATQVAAASNGVAVSSFAGAGTLNVVSTSGFPASGTLTAATSTGQATITYTGTTATTFTGCTTTAGTGNLTTGGLVVTVTNANIAGSEFMGIATPVNPNSYVDWYGSLRLNANDCLVGGSNTATALTINGEGEIGVA